MTDGMMRASHQVWCPCAHELVPKDRCDRCDWWDDPMEDDYEEQPLYRPEHLQQMSVDELQREVERLCDQQGRLGDADIIDERALEMVDARYRLVKAEIKRRTTQNAARGEDK